MENINFKKSYLAFIIPALFIGACGGSSSSPGAGSSGTAITESIGAYPYSLTYAGISTPIYINFSSPIESGTINTNTFYLTTSNGSQVPGSIIATNESAIFTPTESLSFAATYTIHLTSGITDAESNPITPFSKSFTTQTVAFTIFVSNESSTGNILGSSGAANGIVAADNICNADSQCTFGTCKAMLVESTGIRQAAPTQINWVLQPYAAYKNLSGNIIGVTGESGTYVNASNPFVFGFSLESAVQSSGGYRVWTGLNGNWNSASAACNSWTSPSASDPGIHGYGYDKSSEAITDGSSNCNKLNYVYCVQQP